MFIPNTIHRKALDAAPSQDGAAPVFDLQDQLQSSSTKYAHSFVAIFVFQWLLALLLVIPLPRPLYVTLILGVISGLTPILFFIERQQRNLKAMLLQVENLVSARTQQLETSQKQLALQQQALIATEKMSALGEMAGGMAHEINTPLAVILMRTELLADQANRWALDERTLLEGLKGISGPAHRIKAIVQSLRSFVRDGKRDPMSPHSVRKMLDDTLILCLERFKLSKVSVEVSPFEDFQLSCRPSEISQVLLNLLNNSFDAIANQPNKWIKIDVSKPEETFEISVTDCGNGIPEAVRNKLMQPFFTTKGVGKGTGLGLSISKGIIESHGGKLWIDASNSNTRFVMTLPTRQLHSEIEATATAEAA